MKLFLTLAFILQSSSSLFGDDKPNILFIFSDDWGWGDLSCHGHPYVKTPTFPNSSKTGK